jgi:hypothetical protein
MDGSLGGGQIAGVTTERRRHKYCTARTEAKE